jgi:hypothetical protein
MGAIARSARRGLTGRLGISHQTIPEETTMHPYIQQQLTGTRIAEMRSEAERHQTARAARRARRAARRPASQPDAGPGSVLHHVLSALLTTYGQRRQLGTAAAQAPQGLRP